MLIFLAKKKFEMRRDFKKNFDLEHEKNSKNISRGDLTWFQKHSRSCVGIVSCLCIPVVSGYNFGSLLITL